MLYIDHHIEFDTTASINIKGLQASFGVRCKLLPLDAHKDLLGRWTGFKVNDHGVMEQIERPEGQPLLTDKDYIAAFLVSVNDLMDANGPVASSPESIAKLLNVPGATAAIIQAYKSGYDEVDAKN